MTEVMRGVNGEMIRWAREYYNMTQERASSAIGVSIEQYKKWELGQEYPTYAKLKKISAVFRKPSAIFFLPSPPRIPVSKGELRTLPNTVVSKFSKNIIIQFEKAKAYQLNLKDLYGEKKSIIAQRNQFPNDQNSLCIFLRQKIGITLSEQKAERNSSTLFEKFRKKLYELGIYVFKDAFKDESISGISLNDDDYPVIIINNTMSFARQIFTLFHEIFHLISDTSGVEIIRDDYYIELNAQQEKIERACDSFANAFLVPIDDFVREIGNNTADEMQIERLATLYSVSKEAIMYKLYMMKKITSSEYNRWKEFFYGDAIRKGKKGESGGNHYNTKLSYLGYTYTGDVLERYSAGIIDEVRAGEMLQSKIDNLPIIENIYQRRMTR